MSGSASRSADASSASACTRAAPAARTSGRRSQRPRRQQRQIESRTRARVGRVRRLDQAGRKRRRPAQPEQRGQLAARHVQLRLRVDDGVLVAEALELDLAQLGLGDVARPEPRPRDLDRLRVAVGDVVRELPLRLLAHRLREGGANARRRSRAARPRSADGAALDALARPRGCARCASSRRRRSR